MADNDDKDAKATDGDSNGATNGGAAPGFTGEAPKVTSVPKPPDPSLPRMNVLAQYVKDLSFENPDAPKSLTARQKPPKVDVRINVQVNRQTESDMEVSLKLEATGKDVDLDQTLFQAELVYAGLFKIANVPENQLGALAMVECPRLLFPFARQIIADATRGGGFPPLLLEPVDFVALYRERLRREAEGSGPPLNLSPPANA